MIMSMTTASSSGIDDATTMNKYICAMLLRPHEQKLFAILRERVGELRRYMEQSI